MLSRRQPFSPDDGSRAGVAVTTISVPRTASCALFAARTSMPSFRDMSMAKLAQASGISMISLLTSCPSDTKEWEYRPKKTVVQELEVIAGIAVAYRLLQRGEGKDSPVACQTLLNSKLVSLLDTLSIMRISRIARLKSGFTISICRRLPKPPPICACRREIRRENPSFATEP